MVTISQVVAGLGLEETVRLIPVACCKARFSCEAIVRAWNSFTEWEDWGVQEGPEMEVLGVHESESSSVSNEMIESTDPT
jgi:hypothetical protein